MKVVLDQGMLYMIPEHADEEGALDLIADRAVRRALDVSRENGALLLRVQFGRKLRRVRKRGSAARGVTKRRSRARAG